MKLELFGIRQCSVPCLAGRIPEKFPFASHWSFALYLFGRHGIRFFRLRPSTRGSDHTERHESLMTVATPGYHLPFLSKLGEKLFFRSTSR
jgi:hypothetical protein